MAAACGRFVQPDNERAAAHGDRGQIVPVGARIGAIAGNDLLIDRDGGQYRVGGVPYRIGCIERAGQVSIGLPGGTDAVGAVGQIGKRPLCFCCATIGTDAVPVGFVAGSSRIGESIETGLRKACIAVVEDLDEIDGGRIGSTGGSTGGATGGAGSAGASTLSIRIASARTWPLPVGDSFSPTTSVLPLTVTVARSCQSAPASVRSPGTIC